MARQEDGWPLGLQPVNARVGFVRNREQSGSISFTTLLTPSTASSTFSSSDLHTESTRSFFRDRSDTLGSLLGISSILELSRRSIRNNRTAEISGDRRNNTKSKPWFFSLCSKLSSDAVIMEDDSNDFNTPSLGFFLESERSARNEI